MKKFIAVLTASVLMASMTAFAADSPSAKAVVASVAASDEGFTNGLDAQAAAQRGMTAGEYYNNTITSTPGLKNTVAVGQGGKILINGVATNLTATLSKVTKDVAVDAMSQAGVLGGSLLNVVSVGFPGANYKVATINFYVKDLAAGTKIVAKQYVNGAWIDVEVVEVRDGHAVLNLTKSGAVAFIALP